jgi:hypothetical protein
LGGRKSYGPSSTASLPVGKFEQISVGRRGLSIFLWVNVLGDEAHAADLAGFKENAVFWAIKWYGLGHVHAASLDVP